MSIREDAPAGGSKAVTGWRLDPGDRQRLLERFPPVFANVVADHVTLAARVANDTPLPSARSGEVIGHAVDPSGVEALIVRIGGAWERPDGSVYHLTWSLRPGREARESNDLLAPRLWTEVAPIPIALIPARLR